MLTAVDVAGNTPLHSALVLYAIRVDPWRVDRDEILGRSLLVIGALLEAASRVSGADAEDTDDDGTIRQFPHQSLLSTDGHSSLTLVHKLILAPNHDGRTPLHLAAGYGGASHVELLVSSLARVIAVRASPRISDCNAVELPRFVSLPAVTVASGEGAESAAVAALLADRRSWIDPVDATMKTPLMEACKTGNAAVVRVLLTGRCAAAAAVVRIGGYRLCEVTGASVTMRDNKHKSALTHALFVLAEARAQLLLQQHRRHGVGGGSGGLPVDDGGDDVLTPSLAVQLPAPDENHLPPPSTGRRGQHHHHRPHQQVSRLEDTEHRALQCVRWLLDAGADVRHFSLAGLRGGGGGGRVYANDEAEEGRRPSRIGGRRAVDDARCVEGVGAALLADLADEFACFSSCH